MTAKSVIVAAAVALAICAGARAQTAPAQSNAQALIAQLSSDNWRTRQAAQERLVQLGDEVCTVLEDAARHTTDQETLRRLRAALQQIEEDRMSGPTVLSLHLRDVPANAAFDQIAKAAHVQIQTDPAELWQSRAWPRVTLDADHQPFWSVLRTLCGQVGVEPHMSAAPQSPALIICESQGQWTNDPAVVSGPAVICAVQARGTHQVQYHMPNDVDRALEVALSAMLEPKLRVIQGTAVAVLEEAVDDKGTSLLPANQDNDATTANPGDNPHAWDLRFNLNYPADVGGKIARLKGTLCLTVPTELETGQILDPIPAVDVPRTVGSKRFVVRASRRGKAYDVQMTVLRDGMAEADWRIMVRSSPCESICLVDEAGRTLQPNRAETDTDGANKQLTLNLLFDPYAGGGEVAFGKPAKLVWEVATQTKDLRLPFEFDDLPLP